MNMIQPEELGLEVVYKTVRNNPLNLNFRSDFGWRPADGRSYSAWMQD